MYAIDALAADPATFREAVQQRQAFVPLYVKIKVLHACNLRCAMCNHWRRPQNRPLSIARLRAILDELAALGCRKIHFSGGEPLLRRQLPDLVAHGTALGLRMNLTSNGTLIDKERARRLIESGLRHINVSLDSPDPRVHDRVRGVPGAWKKTTRAITYLRRWAHKGKLSIRINTVVNRLNYQSLAALPDLAHRLGASTLNLIPVDDHTEEDVVLNRSAIEEFNALVAPVIAERALALGLMTQEQEAYPFGTTYDDIRLSRLGHYARNWYRNHPCFAPWTHSLIDYNGDVYVCCMTRERIPPIGNLRENTFADIWQGPGYAALRQRMHPPDLSACSHCDDFLSENRQLLSIAEPGLERVSTSSHINLFATDPDVLFATEITESTEG